MAQVSVPSVDKTTNMAVDSGKAAVAALVGSQLGASVVGGPGAGLGAIAGGAAVGGTEGKVVATVGALQLANSFMSGAATGGNGGAGDI